MPKASKTSNTANLNISENVSDKTLSVIEPSLISEKKTKAPRTKVPKQSTEGNTVTVTVTEPTTVLDVPVTIQPALSLEDTTVTNTVSVIETEEPEVSVVSQSLEFVSKLNQISVLFNQLKTEYKTLEKKWLKELKASSKSSKHKKRKINANRAPSGFVKPALISDELATFLQKPVGTWLARTDVTREINLYIQKNKLQDTTNGRRIIPDGKLATLLKLQSTDELTYFNLQKYMSSHFIKAEKEVVQVAQASATV
jgi:chromatin remodeling complex protein RSC6